VESPRTLGRQRVAQGESASPGCAVRKLTSPRIRGRQRVAQGESASPGCAVRKLTSPRIRGRQHVAQGESASLGGAVRKHTSPRIRGRQRRSGQNVRSAWQITRRHRALINSLSPASTRARVPSVLYTQGSRTRPGLHAVAREYACSCPSANIPRARRLALGYTLLPASTRADQLRWWNLGSRQLPDTGACRQFLKKPALGRWDSPGSSQSLRWWDWKFR